MSIEATISTLLGGSEITLGHSVGGGSISRAVRGTAAGRPIFVKLAPGGAEGLFHAEARGLAALREAGGCRVPEVLAVSDHEGVLVLEWIERQRGGERFQETLGRGLATQHRQTRETFGFDEDNFIGATPQPNPEATDHVVFFRDHRLGFQQDLLRRAGRCPPSLDRALDRVRARLGEWLLAEERPALLHGDLWTGNAMAGPGGEAVIYDPAVYYGAREADLAMTELFGSFGGRFRAAYEEVWPLEPGYDERRDLYNLYHVLNHANLFGGGYAHQAESIAQRYT